MVLFAVGEEEAGLANATFSALVLLYASINNDQDSYPKSCWLPEARTTEWRLALAQPGAKQTRKQSEAMADSTKWKLVMAEMKK